MRAQHLLRTTSLVLGTGYVLFFFSERMFWAMWRPGDHIGIYVATWLLYAFLAYLLQATVRCFRVRDLWGLFLAGTVFGWLAEGDECAGAWIAQHAAKRSLSPRIHALPVHAQVG